MIKSKISLQENFVIRKIVQYRFHIIIALIMFQFLGMTNRYIFFQGGDNAAYFSLAQSIIENNSYLDTHTYPVTPHTRYPFMFPLLISIVLFFWGKNILITKIIIIAGSAILMTGTTTLIWQDREKKYIPIITALLVGTVPLTLLYSSRLLTEIPYTAFSCLAILFAERAHEVKSIKNSNFVLCVLFCIISYFTRTIGVTLPIAIIFASMSTTPIWPNLKQNCLKIATVSLAFIFFAGAWYFRGLILTGGQVKGYLQQFFIKNTYIVGSPSIGITDVFERIHSNSVYYLRELVTSFFPFSTFPYNGKIILGSIILFIIVLGFGGVIKQRRGVPEFYLAFYVFVILAWGFRESRFLIPIFPFLIYYLIKGIEILIVTVLFPFSQKFRWLIKDISIVGIVFIILYSNISINIQSLKMMNKINGSKGIEINPFFNIIATNNAMARMLNLAAFLRNYSDPETIILARKPRLVYLASGHPTIGGPFSQVPEEFIKRLKQKKISFIIVDERYPKLRNASIAAIKAYPGNFKVIYRIPDSNSMILRFAPDPDKS